MLGLLLLSLPPQITTLMPSLLPRLLAHLRFVVKSMRENVVTRNLDAFTLACTVVVLTAPSDATADDTSGMTRHGEEGAVAGTGSHVDHDGAGSA